MPKLRRLSGRQVFAILERNGFVKVRQRGSHIVMQRRVGEDDSISVVVPNHKEIDRGTLSAIIRQSGLDRELFSS
ncbi:MAG: type II toxin-antitoxin system HicA family toxin [Acidobacteria bacterium]|nr:type II toxin-antitoxin system HicA family toxin [Acidobacteriota bacterium]MCI0718876.1 type II toxin-antitoxin system HicA family toxin [Acidobacteriota bacterium]